MPMASAPTIGSRRRRAGERPARAQPAHDTTTTTMVLKSEKTRSFERGNFTVGNLSDKFRHSLLSNRTARVESQAS
jgi:hypothetical protein